jgi:hypothetical protein
MKGIFRPAAMCDRIGERADHLVELDHRTRPAMRHQQGHSVELRRAHMQKVNVEAIDFRDELAKAVQHRLAAPPVVIGAPIIRDGAHLRQRHALIPALAGFLLRPARVFQPPPQINEHGLFDRENEWANTIVHAVSPSFLKTKFEPRSGVAYRKLAA